MVKAFINMKMDHMKDNINMDRNMGKVGFNIMMDPVMKVITKIMKDKDLGSIYGQMAEGILGNGKMIKWMVLAYMNGEMVKNM